MEDTGQNESGFNQPTPTVDWSVLAKFEVQIPGEPNLIEELIQLYLEDTAEHMVIIERAITEADRSTLKRAAHSLKGSSANLGIKRLAELSEEFETIGDSDFESIRSLWPGFELEFTRVRQVLSSDVDRRS